VRDDLGALGFARRSVQFFCVLPRMRSGLAHFPAGELLVELTQREVDERRAADMRLHYILKWPEQVDEDVVDTIVVMSKRWERFIALEHCLREVEVDVRIHAQEKMLEHSRC
jgi:hypothetical protein